MNKLKQKLKTVTIFGYLLIDLINPKRWLDVIVSILIKKYGEQLLTMHGVEQLMFRRGQCPNCIMNGKCTGLGTCEGCNCPTWDKMLVPDSKCHCGNWGPFKTKEEWIAYKDKFKIKFFYQLNEVTKEII